MFCSCNHASQASVCSVFPRPCHPAGSRPPDVREMTKKIKPVLLVGPHLGLDAVGQVGGRNAFEILKALAKPAGVGGIGKPLSPSSSRCAACSSRCVEGWARVISTQVGHGFMRGLHGGCVEFHPTRNQGV